MKYLRYNGDRLRKNDPLALKWNSEFGSRAASQSLVGRGGGTPEEVAAGVVGSMAGKEHHPINFPRAVSREQQPRLAQAGAAGRLPLR